MRMLADIDIRLSEDDVEDLLAALEAYEAALLLDDDGSMYTFEVVGNVESLRGRLADALRRGMH